MELWDLVDENRNMLGKTHNRGIELNKGEYHIVVEIFTVNADGRILLTQRDPVKTYPLLWEITGGSITAGESSLEGAVRELEEETGLLAAPEQLKKIGEIKYAHYFRDSYIWKAQELIDPAAMKLQPGEVCDAKLVSFEELQEMDEAGLTVPSVIERCRLYHEDLHKMIIG
ncbi:NUDIX hydrolase [Planococcus salinarum]|uniref:NUDIX hydrolase n=1 Tax=Planococcus salinarum TaxID=622695 RepID=UPI000E3C57FE|nr:NUDIX domain-containing protein [Planococcus salinarum]TAA69734.1 NUDIX domain-containing protein [Planococcus salinarum]